MVLPTLEVTGVDGVAMKAGSGEGAAIPPACRPIG